MKKVIIRTREGDLRDVAPVIRETKTLVIAGHNGKKQYELKKPFVGRGQWGDYKFPADEEITKAEKELAAIKRKQDAEKKAQAEKLAKAKADPRYELLQRFGNGADFEPWRKLTLKQLQTIADIFDSVK